MSGLKQYADIFGKPGTGAHQYRIGGDYPKGIAIVDTVGTILIALLAWWILTSRSLLAFIVVFIIMMAITFVSHVAFGVKTPDVLKAEKIFNIKLV